MTRLTLLLLVLTFSLKADLIEDYRRSKKVVVIHGENAPAAEIHAAQEIFKILELDKTDDLYDHIITDTYALKHQFFYSSFNLIIVGTSKSNRLFSNNAEIQLAGPVKNSSPIKILPELNKSKDALFSAHFGYYPKTAGIGYIRRVLNPLTLQTFNLTKGKMNAHPYTATYLGGTDSDGVVKAYVKFLDLKMMEGAVIPKSCLGAKNSRFRLSGTNVKEDILDRINTKIKVHLGQDTLQYKGWIQGTTGDYAGVKELCGVSAEQIFHLKYSGKTPQLMTYDEQANTVLLINFKDEASSLAALETMDKNLKLSLKIKKEPGFTLYPCSTGETGWYLMRQGSMLFIENFSEQWKEPFVRQASGILKN